MTCATGSPAFSNGGLGTGSGPTGAGLKMDTSATGGCWIMVVVGRPAPGLWTYLLMMMGGRWLGGLA